MNINELNDNQKARIEAISLAAKNLGEVIYGSGSNGIAKTMQIDDTIIQIVVSVTRRGVENVN